jgi:hypothetical protein
VLGHEPGDLREGEDEDEVEEELQGRDAGLVRLLALGLSRLDRRRGRFDRRMMAFRA